MSPPPKFETATLITSYYDIEIILLILYSSYIMLQVESLMICFGIKQNDNRGSKVY